MQDEGAMVLGMDPLNALCPCNTAPIVFTCALGVGCQCEQHYESAMEKQTGKEGGADLQSLA